MGRGQVVRACFRSFVIKYVNGSIVGCHAIPVRRSPTPSATSQMEVMRPANWVAVRRRICCAALTPLLQSILNRQLSGVTGNDHHLIEIPCKPARLSKGGVEAAILIRLPAAVRQRGLLCKPRYRWGRPRCVIDWTVCLDSRCLRPHCRPRPLAWRQRPSSSRPTAPSVPLPDGLTGDCRASACR